MAGTNLLVRGLLLSLFCLVVCPSGQAREAKAGQGSSIDRLITQLGDESFVRRMEAEKQLAKRRGKPVFVALTRAAKGHRDPEVRCRAARALEPVRDAWLAKFATVRSDLQVSSSLQATHLGNPVRCLAATPKAD